MKNSRYFFAAIPFLVASLASYGAFAADFPIPRAEKEFRKAASFAEEYGLQVKKDKDKFLGSVQPYGPLGFQVEKAWNNKEAELLKNFFLGYAGSVFELDPSVVTDRFHCGPPCTEGRMYKLDKSLPGIGRLVGTFNALSQVRLLGYWGSAGEYRVNDLYAFRESSREAIPSSEMGFVPSGNWKEWKSRGEYLQSIKTDQAAVEKAVSQMALLRVSSIIREGAGVTRVILFGIADNESGLLYVGNAGQVPKVNDEDLSGRRYTFVKELAKNIFYYETT